MYKHHGFFNLVLNGIQLQIIDIITVMLVL
jgi:hypothetical protein